MPGAEKLKSVCFKCEVNKWAVDFREGCHSKLSSTSVCLSCEQAALILAQKRDIDRLKIREQEQDDRIRKLEEHISKIEKLISREGGEEQAESRRTNSDNLSNNLDIKAVDTKVEELRTVVMENREDIVETGRQVVEIREEISSFKDDRNFRVVKGKKSPKISSREQGITVSNRFAALEVDVDAPEVEAYVIGDSIVREQNNYFARENKQTRKVYSYPGGKTNKVTDGVKELKVKNRNTCIIANAGSNDLYQKGNKVGNTEPLVEDLKSLVNQVAAKTDKGIVIGIMPRVYASYYAMSKAIGINDRLNKFCEQKKVEFLDVWKIFIGRWQYYRKDGIHLNELGHRKLGELLHQNFDRLKNKVNLTPLAKEKSAKIQVSPEVDDNSFMGFPKENC